jgi:hypothetical protein
MLEETEHDSTIDPAVVWQIGKDIWEFVEDNKPVVNYTSDWTGVVPKGVEAWTEMSNWNTYSSPAYDIKFVNGLGMTLTEFEWVWKYEYGGKYNGVGAYIANAGASLNKIYAMTSEHVDVEVTSLNPFNYGTTANPIGGVDISVKMTSSGIFKKTIVGCQVTVKGDGTYKVATCDSGTHHV